MYQRSIVERLESRSLFSGGLDPTFGTNGVVSGEVDYLPGGVPVAVMVRSDKRIVVAANYTQGTDPSTNTGEALVGLLPDGSLDPTFGVKGIDDLGSTPFQSLSGAVMQPDGKVLVVGYGGNNPNAWQLVLERFNPDGTPDSTFATNGVATVDLPNGFSPDISGAEAVALAPDGKIITAEVSSNDSGSSVETVVGVTRFTASGQLDFTFATAGRLVINDSPAATYQITGVAVDRSGRVVIGGDDGLIRITSSGTLDSSFGTDGQVTFPTSDNFFGINAIAVHPNGDIVAVSSVQAGDTNSIFAMQYTASGKQDRAFGKNGTRSITLPDRSVQDTAANSYVSSVTVDRHNRIVIAGSANLSAPGSVDEAQASDIAVVRLTPSGALDASFGKGGREEIGGGNLWAGQSNTAEAICVELDGSVVVAGNSTDGDGTTTGQGLVLARERASGSLDPSFGYQGRAGIFPALPQTQFAISQPDGKLLLAGLYSIARLTSTGTPDPSFGVKGFNLGSQDYVDDLRLGLLRGLGAAQVTLNGRIVEVISIQNNSGVERTVLPFEIRSYGANGSGNGALSGQLAARQLMHRFAGYYPGSTLIQSNSAIMMLGSDSNQDAIIVRLTPQGALDPSFGKDGAMVLNLPGITNPTFGQIYGDADNGVILIGAGSPTDTASPPTYPVFTARLDDKGHLDPNFGGMLYSLPVAFADETPIPPTLQAADGSIYLMKSASVILHLVNGAPDTSLSADGSVTLAIPAGFTGNGSGTFDVLGNRIFLPLSDSNENSALAALHLDGTLDTTFADNGILALPADLSEQFISGENGTLILADPLESIVARVDMTGN